MDPKPSAETLKALKDLLGLSAEALEKAQKAAADNLVPTPAVTAWLKSPKQRMLRFAIVLLLVSGVTNLVLLVWHRATLSTSPLITFLLSSKCIYVIECVLLILICLYIVGKGSRDASDSIDVEAKIGRAMQRAIQAENQFFSYWPLLWAVWFLLYMALAWRSIVPPVSPVPLLPDAFATSLNALNNLSGMFLWSLFYEMSESTAANPANKRQHWIIPFMIIVALFVAEMVAKQLVVPDDVAAVQYVFNLISGVVVGVCTGLLVARLSSPIFSFPTPTIVVLTTFVVVQPVYPAMTLSGDGVASGAVAYTVALVAMYCKVVLLVAIEWSRDRFTFLFYMVRIARLTKDLKRGRQKDEFAALANVMLAKRTEIE